MRAPSRAWVGALLLTNACAELRGKPEQAQPLAAELLPPASVRRLTVPELERTYTELLGFTVELAQELPPDVRQNGFTPNQAAAVTPVFAAALHAQTSALAERAVSERLSLLAPCAASADAACAAQFIADFGARAFRRALGSDERARYLAVFNAGSAGGDFGSGLALVLATLLESPNLLYVSELGAPEIAGAPTTRLTSDEVASVLAFALTGGPPDDALLAAATNGALADADGREQEARRLLDLTSTRNHYERFVLQWLGLDGLNDLAKDPTIYPQFPALLSGMESDTLAFVDGALVADGGSLGALLGGGADPARPGLLQQPGFLAVHSHPTDSGPVLRGATVLRRVLCENLPSPFELGVEIVPPPPDPNLTTRERFAQHSNDPACAACHASIDGVGFTFENFDAIGAVRSQEAGRPIDTHGELSDDTGSRPLADSAELSRALIADPEAADCLARQVFRYFSGRDLPASEDAFVDQVHAGAPNDSVLGLVIALSRSELMVRRRAP